jgi:hypothetical protein
MPIDAVAFHLILCREGLDVRDPTEKFADRAETAFDVPSLHVLKHVGAYDEIALSE